MSNILSLNNISKNYHTKEGEITAIKDISLSLNKGDILGILGPSGCGKSTLLNIISNLDKPTTGTITKDKIKLSYMFQTDALLPWLTIKDNSLLGLSLTNNLSKDNIDYTINLIKEFGLYDYLNKYPSSLSGGMKQRVACYIYKQKKSSIKEDNLYINYAINIDGFLSNISLLITFLACNPLSVLIRSKSTY